MVKSQFVILVVLVAVATFAPGLIISIYLKQVECQTVGISDSNIYFKDHNFGSTKL